MMMWLQVLGVKCCDKLIEAVMVMMMLQLQVLGVECCDKLMLSWWWWWCCSYRCWGLSAVTKWCCHGDDDDVVTGAGGWVLWQTDWCRPAPADRGYTGIWRWMGGNPGLRCASRTSYLQTGECSSKNVLFANFSNTDLNILKNNVPVCLRVCCVLPSLYWLYVLLCLQLTWLPNEVNHHNLVVLSLLERVQNPKGWYRCKH